MFLNCEDLIAEQNCAATVQVWSNSDRYKDIKTQAKDIAQFKDPLQKVTM